MEQKEMGPLLLFTGDSITDGLRYKKKKEEWDLNHQIGHSYVYILNGVLGSRYPEKRLRFKNRGISGNRIVDLYARIEPDLLAIEPDVLTILVGVNDGPLDINEYKPTPQKKYEALYRMLLEEVRERLPECKIILMEPFVLNAGKMREEGNYDLWRSAVSGFGQVVRKLSQEFGTAFVPLQGKFDEMAEAYGADYWCWDGVHPTENGHGLIARQWLAVAGDVVGLPGEF